MIIDGKQIADTFRTRLSTTVAKYKKSPTLAIVIVGENPVVERFVRIKTKFGKDIGATVKEFRFAGDVEEKLLREEIATLAQGDDIDGIIVQLPLPPYLDTQKILDAIAIEKDVDVLSTSALALFAQGEAKIIPPVASAVKEILDVGNISVAGEEVLVLGFGRLVGKPVSILLRHNGAHVTVIDRPVADLKEHVQESSVIVSGVGSPSLITPLMPKDGSVLIDAGTSESGGKLVGDIDPACAARARLFTPVPGGVGPVTVAMLFKNLCILAKARAE